MTVSTPAEIRVYNILSAHTDSAYISELPLSAIQTVHADKHGTYNGVTEALNSLAKKGAIYTFMAKPLHEDIYRHASDPGSPEPHYGIVLVGPRQQCISKPPQREYFNSAEMIF